MPQMLKGEIVIIDDQPEDLENLQKFLVLEGFDAQIIETGAHFVHSERPETDSSVIPFLDGGMHQQIFLISLDLLDEDPLEIFEALSERFPRARFGFLAYSFDTERAEDFFAAGVDAFFTKPISIEKFMSWATDESALAVDTGRFPTAKAV